MNRTTTTKSFPCFFRDGNNISNKMNIANKFNTFFTNVEKNLNNAISLPHDKDYLKNRYNPKLTFQNIDEVNVGELINKLSPKTCFPKLLKSIKTAVIKVECHANAKYENPYQNSEKIACIGQRLIYPIMEEKKKPHHARLIFKCHLVFRYLH